MDERKTKILYSIIQDFICTGEPVGSRTLSKKYNLGVSSATIRNEMSDLEELGFLEQVHTSSGRRPSNKGYRLYVDKLMIPAQITKQEELYIKSDLMNLDIFDIENVLKSKLALISKLTNLACILKIPSVMKNSIKSVQFIKIDHINLLVVIVTNEGIIRNSVIRVRDFISNNDIEIINKIVNENLACCTVEDISVDVINRVKSALKLNGYVFDQVITILYDVFKDDKGSECYIEGVNNILNYPEFSDIDKVKSFLCFLDNRGKFESLLNCNKEDDLEIRIGDENYVEEAQNYSIVLGNYKKNSKVLGTIGIIGPTRMNYSKIVSILRSLIDFINSSID